MGAKEQGADATQGRWLTIPRTLCFVFYEQDILLMKRGAHRRVFPNRYNGLGGHIERGEDPATCAEREIREESGLAVCDLRLRGVYNIDTGAQTGILLYVYTAWATTRTLGAVTHDEGTLHWVPRDAVLSLDLVEDLPHILPRILQAGTDTPVFSAHLSYDAQDQLQMYFYSPDVCK